MVQDDVSEKPAHLSWDPDDNEASHVESRGESPCNISKTGMVLMERKARVAEA